MPSKYKYNPENNWIFILGNDTEIGCSVNFGDCSWKVLLILIIGIVAITATSIIVKLLVQPGKKETVQRGEK